MASWQSGRHKRKVTDIAADRRKVMEASFEVDFGESATSGAAGGVRFGVNRTSFKLHHRSCRSAVAMMQPANHRDRNDLAAIRRLYFPRFGTVIIQ